MKIRSGGRGAQASIIYVNQHLALFGCDTSSLSGVTHGFPVYTTDAGLSGLRVYTFHTHALAQTHTHTTMY